MKDILLDVLDEHLNSGCIDSRCDLGGAVGDLIPMSFIEHLAEEVLDAINAE